MPTSNARIEANRRNSQKSTGPKTAAGKAASRLNAFQHGMAGMGDVLGPGEEARTIADRAESFARELGAVGATGRVFAHRAALLSVRLERLAEDLSVAVRSAERQALTDFDADRGDAIDELIAIAADPEADPAEALAALAECPDGLARLIREWRDLLGQLRAPDPEDAVALAARWLGIGEGKDLTIGDVISHAEAEFDRLRGLAGTMGAATRAVERERAEVGRQARLDPPPAVALARRYEAAVERGLFRAMRAIADINRQAGRVATPVTAAPGPVEAPAAPPRSPASVAPMASFRPGMAEPLASFRAGAAPAPVAPVAGPEVPQDRPVRPDYRRIERELAALRH